jgi:hypothetical protein
MEKFLRVCGNLDEYLYEDKIHELMSNEEEYDIIQTIQYIQCKLDESIQDNNEARSLVSLINDENIQNWWKIIQDLYFPMHEASRNRRCEEFEELRQLHGEPTSLFTTRIVKHARMLRKQGEEISEGKLTKIFCRGISPIFKERLENYSLTLDIVTFDKLKLFGEKLDAIRISSPAKTLNFIGAKANLEIDAQNQQINTFQHHRAPPHQNFPSNPSNNSKSVKCYYCQKMGHKKSECRKRKSDQQHSSDNYRHSTHQNNQRKFTKP